MKNLFFPFALAFILLSSFSHHTGISIQILSPDEKALFSARDTIRIKAEIKAHESLHNVNIKVISLKDSSILFRKNIHTHSANASVNEFFINPMLEAATLRLSIETTDHSGTQTSVQSVNFKSAAAKNRKGK